MTRERVVARLRNAQAKGVQLGRRKAVFDRKTFRELARKGMSIRQIAKKLGLGYGTVRRALKGLKSPAKK